MALESTSTTSVTIQSEHQVLEPGVGSGQSGDLELMEKDVLCLDNNVASDDIMWRDKCEETGLGRSSLHDNDPNNTSSESMTTYHRCGFEGRSGVS